MDVHLAAALVFYMLWYQPSFTVNCQKSDICVFGTDTSCFYQCKCPYFCSPEYPNCKICNDLTGICIMEEPACQSDDFINYIYETRYWTGAACQKGNIAAMKLTGVSGDVVNIEPVLGYPTDESLYTFFTVEVTRFLHTATIYLEETHKVEFLDIFLESVDINISSLVEYVQVKLVMKNGSFSECVYTEVPSNDHRLKDSLVNEERAHFLCNEPSIGYMLNVSMQATGGDVYEVNIYEIIIIGYRYAEVNAQRCLQMEGDEEISWCSQCNNSLPPECQEECPQSLTGINCNGNSKSSKGSTVSSGFVFVPLVITVGPLICLLGIL